MENNALLLSMKMIRKYLVWITSLSMISFEKQYNKLSVLRSRKHTHIGMSIDYCNDRSVEKIENEIPRGRNKGIW